MRGNQSVTVYENSNVFWYAKFSNFQRCVCRKQSHHIRQGETKVSSRSQDLTELSRKYRERRFLTFCLFNVRMVDIEALYNH